MSRYAKLQEDRVEKHLVKLGFRVIEDTARRKKDCADRIVEHVDTGFTMCVDNKSTTGAETMTFHRKWFDKVKEDSQNYERLTGVKSYPVITLTFKGSQKILACFDLDDLEGLIY